MLSEGRSNRFVLGVSKSAEAEIAEIEDGGQAATSWLKYVPPSTTASTAFNKHDISFFAQRPLIPARLASISSCPDGPDVTNKMRPSGCRAVKGRPVSSPFFGGI